MSMTRNITKEQMIIFDLIKEKSKNSGTEITSLLEQMSGNTPFMAAICGSAISELESEHCKNIIIEIFNVLKTTAQRNALYAEVKKLFTPEQLALSFMAHIDDDYVESMRILCNCNLSSNFLSDIITNKNIKNADILDKVLAAVVDCCRNNKNYDLLETLASHIDNPTQEHKHRYGRLLLVAIKEAPADKRINIIKKFLQAQVSLDWHFFERESLKTVHHVIKNKFYDVLELIIEHANTENIKFIADGIAYALTNSEIECQEVLKRFNNKLNSELNEIFFTALRVSLKQDQANSAFLAHMNDKLPSDIVNMLLKRGVSIETQIQVIEKCSDLENAKLYMDNFVKELKQLPESKEENLHLKKLIDVCDWRLIEKLADTILPGNEKNYGKALTKLLRNDPNKLDIIQKLVDSNASLSEPISGGFKPIHCMVFHNNYAALNILFKNCSDQEIAKQIADILIDTNPDIVKNQNDFIKAVENYLNSEQIFLILKEILKKNAKVFFLKHLNNDIPSAVLEILMKCDISFSIHIKAIETCENIETAAKYLDHFLEQKIDSNDLENVIKAVLARFRKKEDWRLIDILATKIKPDNEKNYGRLLLHAAKFGKKEIAKKLVDINASLTNYEYANKLDTYALHYFESNKWKDLISEYLKPERLETLADGVAAIIKMENNEHARSALKSFYEIITNHPLRTLFYYELSKKISASLVEYLFKKHFDDNGWSIVAILWNCGVSIDAFIHNIENSKEKIDYNGYISQLLKRKIEEAEFEKIMNAAIRLSEKRTDEKWTFIDAIIEKKIDLPNSPVVYGKALFHKMKSKQITLDEVRALMSLKASVDLPFDDGDTAIHVAVRKYGNDSNLDQTLAILLGEKDNSGLSNKKGETAVSLAIQHKNYYLAALLQSNIEEGEKLMAQRKMDPQFDTLCGVFYNKLSALQNILDEHSALSQEEKPDVVRMRGVMARFVYATVCEMYNKDESLEKSNIEILMQLLKSDNILKIPASEIKKLLSYQDKAGNTALHMAVKQGHVALVKILLNAGADPYQINHNNLTAFALAEECRKMIVIQMFKITPDKREQLLQSIGVRGEETIEKELQDGEKKIKQIAWKALKDCNPNGILDWAKYAEKSNNFSSLFTAAALGFIVSETKMEQENFQAYLNIDVSKLSFISYRLSENEKIKLKALQKFYRDNLEHLRLAKSQYPYLDKFTLILLVMKNRLIGKIKTKDEEWEIDAKDKVMSTLRMIMKEELGMSDSQVDSEMDIKLNIIRGIINQNSELEQKQIVEKANAVLSSLKYGDMNAIQKRAEFCREDAKSFSPNYCRILAAYEAAIAYGDKSERATWKFLLRKLSPTKLSSEETATLKLMHDFSIYAMRVSKKLKKYFITPDPIGLHLLVLEHAAQYQRFNAIEIKKILNRFNESFESALIKEGGLSKEQCKAFLDNKINENRERIKEIGDLPKIRDKRTTDGTEISQDPPPPAYEYLNGATEDPYEIIKVPLAIPVVPQPGVNLPVASVVPTNLFQQRVSVSAPAGLVIPKPNVNFASPQ